MSSPDQSRVTKKCPKACERCRSMKVKCSGGNPCRRCERQSEFCTYPMDIKRVLVSKDYLAELQRDREARLDSHGTRISRGERRHTRPSTDSIGQNSRGSGRRLPRPRIDAFAEITQVDEAAASEDEETPRNAGEQQTLSVAETTTPQQQVTGEPSRDDTADDTFHFSQNPPMEHDPPFRPAEGRFWYLAPSSSWAFCRRVLGLLGRSMPPETEASLDPFNTDGKACKMEWEPLRRDETPDVSDLPPRDLSLFFFHAAQYYLGVLNHLIDEGSYLANLKEFYENPTEKASCSRLWYAQHLLLLSFGKAFVSRNKNSRGQPAGHIYAVRAMGMLPIQAEMGPDPLLAVQVLILAAVYLQSVDLRVAAFQYVGQASTLCVCIGMHRHMPERIFGADASRKHNLTFWVAHIVDSEFSALMGSTSSIQNEQITAKLPNVTSDSLEASTMSLHVRLSRLMSTILTTVYGVGNEFDGSLVKDIQSTLRTLAGISTELHAMLDTYFGGSIQKASRTVLRLLLSYHHCVVLTTRPLVMCALHRHLERQTSSRFETLDLRPPVSSILQSCVDSARTILRTLCILSEEDLLGMSECFMPFDLEDAFSSAFLLYVLRDIGPGLFPDAGWKDDINKILQHMVDNGSVVAPLRQRELQQLETILASITPRLRAPSATVGTTVGDDESWSVPGDAADSGKDLFMMDSSVGPSSNILLHWAQQLDMPDFLGDMDYT